jgi:Tol biopolymer transport system component
VIVADDFARSSATLLHSHFAVSGTGVIAYQPASLRNTRLVWVDRSGNDLSVAAAGAATYVDPAVSPDGRLVAVDRFDARTGANKIWVFDLARGTSYQLNPELAQDMYPTWTRDSRALVFSGTHDSGWGLFRKSIDASTAEALERFDLTLTFPTAVSSRGDVVVLKQQSGRSGFRTIILNTADKTQRTIDDGSQATLSPDDRWIAYAVGTSRSVTGASRSNEVYVRSMDESGVRQVVSAGGGTNPRWRADGRELFYINGQTLMSVAVTPGPSLTLGVPRALFTRKDWAANRPAPPPNGFDYDVTPDGQRILLNVVDDSQPQPPITVVVNWPVLLKN